MKFLSRLFGKRREMNLTTALERQHANPRRSAPLLVKDLQPPPEAGEDAYSRQLHAVALKRALAQLNA